MKKLQFGGQTDLDTYNPIPFQPNTSVDLQSMFASLFGDIGGSGSTSGYSSGDRNFDNKDDFTRDYWRKDIDKNVHENYRDKAYDFLDEEIANGNIYDRSDTQNALNDARGQSVNNYFNSEEFSTGVQGLTDQFTEYQNNIDSQTGSVDHSKHTVGHDRGFGNYFKHGGSPYSMQAGGPGPNTPLSFLTFQGGIDPIGLEKFADAVREHESFNDYGIEQIGGGPGRGAYQFERPSMVTAAKKAKRIYKKLKIELPQEFKDIISGDIREANELSPQLQDELFYSSLTKVTAVKNKKGVVTKYDIDVTPSLKKFDYYKPQGLADAWSLLHHKGKVDRTDSFLDSLSRVQSFQKGGGFQDPTFVRKYNKAGKGDTIFDKEMGNLTKTSILGYREDSPDKGESSLTIPGNNISMDKVKLDLLLIPDTGEPVVAAAGSGIHRFPEATQVQEIPMQNLQKGGKIEDAFSSAINKILLDEESLKDGDRLAQIGYGNLITVSDQFNTNIDDILLKEFKDRGKTGLRNRLRKMGIDTLRRDTNDNSIGAQFKTLGLGLRDMVNLQMGGPPQQPQEQPPSLVQTEKGEIISFEDGSLTAVKARKRHKSMKKTEPTDILPPTSYVMSRDKAMRIDKKTADNISFGYGPLLYKEGELGDQISETKFGEIFKSKLETPAKIAMSIMKKFPTTSRDNDMYSEVAKEENKESRFPYIETLKQLSDIKRGVSTPQNLAHGGHVNAVIPSLYNQPYDNAISGLQYGDPVLKRDNNMKVDGLYPKPLYNQGTFSGLNPNKPFVQNKQLGGLIKDLVGAAGDIFGFSASAKASKRLEENQKQTEQDLEDYKLRQTNRNNLGLASGTASLFAQFASQDTDYSFLNVDSIRSRTRNSYTRAGQDLDASQRSVNEMQQASINTLHRSLAGQDPRMAQSIADSNNAQYLGASGNTALQFAREKSGLRRQEADALNNLDFTVAQDRQKGTMYERIAGNTLNQSLFQGLGEQTQNYYDRESNTDLAVTAGNMGARGQLASGLNQLGYVQGDNTNRALDALGNLYDNRNDHHTDNVSPTTQVGTVNTGTPAGPVGSTAVYGTNNPGYGNPANPVCPCGADRYGNCAPC